MRRLKLRSWRSAVVLVAVAAGMTLAASASLASGTAGVVRVAIMTDCKGAFGFGYEPDIGGAEAALATFAHGKVKDPKKPSAGISGITVAGKSMWMPSNPAAVWRAIALETGDPQSPPWAT